ncbi:hypothetical protein CHS0354_031991 [Potamilus streckersoni]|uniref:Uncharacterized protein n=1 Tax=Potamilus streckersoni TaxID=2493646 RepID=A0AAE0TKZ6_9BIVA|nr:hypothetical protein CHS0354_031991 [Potamilus streckersoni]
MHYLRLCILFFCSACVTSKRFNLQVEDFKSNRHRQMQRSEASKPMNRTLLLFKNDVVRLQFCLQRNSFVRVEDLRYSNDGPSDEVSFVLDGQYIGKHTTVVDTNFGQGWNSFHSTGAIGEGKLLPPGRHEINLTVTESDPWGVEVDLVNVDVSDELLDYSHFLCILYCFDDIRYEDIHFTVKDSVPSARFVQNSTLTTCTEMDNVKIDIYHDTATDFMITANLPRYRSFSNQKAPNFDGCNLASPYWIFENVSLSPVRPEIQTSKALMTFSGSGYRVQIVITFSLDMLTPTKEVDDRMIGSVLRIRIPHVKDANVSVNVRYKETNDAWNDLGQINFTSEVTERTWNIPDKTWAYNGANMIHLVVMPNKQDVVIESIRLDRRPTKDRQIHIYDDDDIVIEGLDLDFWYLAPHTMIINRMDNNQSYQDIDVLIVYSKIPWGEGYSQVFVIYQDGTTKLQPVTPHGLDWVPFGSSVIIGQTTISNGRPHAFISRIDLDPYRQYIKLVFNDTSSCILRLETYYTQTKLLIKECIFKKDRQTHPVLTFRSMWEADGNADVDHITVNGDRSRHIVSGWEQLYGTTAVFFRKCISKHNTLSPDIKIHILGKNETVL